MGALFELLIAGGVVLLAVFELVRTRRLLRAHEADAATAEASDGCAPEDDPREPGPRD